METIARILRRGMEGLLTPFDLLGPFWGLTILSVLTGIGMLWVVGKTTPQKLVELARAQMDSAVYEIRLFLDSPKWVLDSLGRLIENSMIYIASMLPAFLILAIPLGIMFLSLEARYGLEPIAVGKSFVISVKLADDVDGRQVQFQADKGVEITSPLMYVASEHMVYARAKATSKTNSSVTVAVGKQRARKSIVTNPQSLQMAPERSSDLDQFFSFGPEPPVGGDIVSIQVPHQSRHRRYLGISMPWWLWWLGVMMIAAFALRKPMGVTI